VLSVATSQQTAHNIAESILTKIDAIRFAEDYNELSQIQKSNWLDRAYVQDHPKTFEGMGPQDIKVRMYADRGEVRLWRKDVGRLTTARNRLYELFINVSTVSFARTLLTCP
jgi:hypothetical protein